MTKYQALASVAILTVFTTGCETEKPVEKAIPAVRTVSAETAAAPSDIRYSGVVEPDTQVDLAFRVAGYVDQIGGLRDASGRFRELQEGDFVGAGTTLARLRPSEYQTRVNYASAVRADAAASLQALEAQLEEAEASLTQVSRDFERASNLFHEKALTKADFDAAEARRNTTQAKRSAILAQIAAQKARIEGAGAQQREASISLADTAITAPFPGVIVSKRIARGSLVGAGTPAFVIADTRIAKVSFGVPDMALKNIHPGDALTVIAEAIPGREFQGRVGAIAPAADPASRVFAIDVDIPNSGQALKVGMVATVILSGPRDAAPLPAIPLTAVVKAKQSESGYGVYTVENRQGVDHVRLQPVALGAVRGNAVLITSGLQTGQKIVATAGLQLKDGERVTLIP